jgi:hypothetical protein
VCNPWLAITLATIMLMFAWVFSPQSWAKPYAVNAGYVILTASIIVTMELVHVNLEDLKVCAAACLSIDASFCCHCHCHCHIPSSPPLVSGLWSVECLIWCGDASFVSR